MEKIYLSEVYQAGQHWFSVVAGSGLPATNCASWDEVVAFLDDLIFEYELVAVK